MYPLRNHKSYLASMGHRLSGIVLTLFLPLHFLLLGSALDGVDRMDSLLAYADLPFVKFAEWGLVVLLGIHFLFGIRVLLLEFTKWPDANRSEQSKRAGYLTGLIVPFFAIALLIGVVFLIRGW